MAKQRHIGFTIFAICSALSARMAIFEPKPHDLTPAEERWGPRPEVKGDQLGILHGLRYYIYGLGVVGLLIVVQDYLGEKSRKDKSIAPQDNSKPTP